jgi:hypothetical protein
LVKSKTRRSSDFRNLPWKFNIDEIETKYSQMNQDNGIHHLYKEGFNNLYASFKEFLIENDLTHDNTKYFKIYSNITIKSIDIIQILGSFYSNE